LRAPDLALAIPQNAQASHAKCNRLRAAAGASDDDELGDVSEDWDTP
jgi:hypothetical protein